MFTLQSFFKASCIVGEHVPCTPQSILNPSCMVDDVAFRSTSRHCPDIFQH